MMTVADLKRVLELYNDEDEVLVWDYADRLQPCHTECREGFLSLAEDYEYPTNVQNAMKDVYLEMMDLK